MSYYLVGVDGGGSKTHAMLFTPNHQLIGESFAGSANIRNDLNGAYASITQAINTLLEKYQIDKNNLVIALGVAGYSLLEAREQLYSRLCSIYPRVKMTSDGHLACLAAYRGQDGGVIICGTGVVTYIIKGGQTSQIGGWGFPHGDLGGAAYLGLEACKLLCQAIDQLIPWSGLLNEIYDKFAQDTLAYKNWLLKATSQQFAEIARMVLAYIDSDSNAANIYNAGVAQIDLLLNAIIKNNKGMPFSLMGGLAKFYYPCLHQSFPQVSLCAIPPAVGGIYVSSLNPGLCRTL
ncbi:MAG: hypothetical protein KBD37_01540 [Burkholderiales bacterium]|nr:hypothetical protein [Burkholderiales bacterium]